MKWRVINTITCMDVTSYGLHPHLPRGQQADMECYAFSSSGNGVMGSTAMSGGF